MNLEKNSMMSKKRNNYICIDGKKYQIISMTFPEINTNDLITSIERNPKIRIELEVNLYNERK